MDDADIPKLKEMTWNVRIRNDKVMYVSNHKVGMMHRYILGLNKADGLVDHLDRNPLNNQKSNLRVTNKSENAINTEKRSGTYSSKYKGVGYDSKRNLYRARVNDYEVGSFKSELDAANAYNFYVKYMYEYPYLNPVASTEWYKYKVFRGFSSFRGVIKSRGKWIASYWDKGKVNRIKSYDSEIGAAIAYNKHELSNKCRINKLNLIDNEGNVLISIDEFKFHLKSSKLA